MTTILKIDASVRETNNQNTNYNSISKSIAQAFVDSWKSIHKEDKFIYRDVGTNPPPFINQDWIGAVFTSPKQRTNEQKALLNISDTLIEELKEADIILISSPMYNYGMPAQLKAWFDQVVRINKTFTFDLSRGDYPLEPIFSNKTGVLITSSGEFGFAKGGIREEMNHLSTHINVLRKYLGIKEFHQINAEYQEFGDDRHKLSVNNAIADAKSLAIEMANK